MILTQNINIKINNANIKHFSKYFNNIKKDDIISISASQLANTSNYIIDVKCDVCGDEKSMVYKTFTRAGYSEHYYLCKKCRSIKNNQEKYGVDNVFQLEDIKSKSKETLLEKYGVDNPSKCEDIQNKKIQTSLLNHGTKHHFQNKEIKQKQIDTVKSRYGVDNVSKLDDIKEKKCQTTFKNYGVRYSHHSDIVLSKMKETNNRIFKVDWTSQNKEVRDKQNATVYKKSVELFKKIHNLDIIGHVDDTYHLHCNDCDNDYQIKMKLLYGRIRGKNKPCVICNPIISSISQKEESIISFIRDYYDGDIIQSDHLILKPKELDIYLPDLKLAFEFNGVYWHDELHKPDDYHKDKTDSCIENGIQLIHIWEDDWDLNSDIIKSFILNKIGKTPNKIYARKCEIRIVENNKLINEFLNSNHIQGFVSSSIKLGLYYNNELVSLMTFKYNNRLNCLELNRFCNKINTNIIGGASKLFKYFINNYDFDKVISYADRGYSNGGLYELLGFNNECVTRPSYHYVVNSVRKHKSNYNKTQLKKQGYDTENMTEHEIMLSRNIYRIYNSVVT